MTIQHLGLLIKKGYSKRCLYSEVKMFKILKHFWQVIDLQTLIVTLLAVGSTYVCLRFKIEADIPTGLIGLAVVFPIVFSINAAYKRREEALKYFSEVRGLGVGLYFAHRDWLSSTGAGPEHAERMRGIIHELLEAIRQDLGHKGRDEDSLAKVFGAFSRLSESHEAMRAAKMGVSEVSRANQYMGKMMVAFECMRNIAHYRTPLTLRAYSHVFLNLFPIAFGPYFAFLCNESEGFPYVGYMVAALYSLVLVSLDNLQEQLEDPFDELGTDDVKLDVVKDYDRILAK